MALTGDGLNHGPQSEPAASRREVIKGIVLALLVVLSLVLSLGLWWGAAGPMAGGELWTPETQPAVNTPSWPEVVRPTRLVIHLAADVHLMALPGSQAYRALWDEGCLEAGLWTDLGPARKEPLREVDLKLVRQGPAVEVIFPDALPWPVVARAYRLRGNSDEAVEGLLVSPGPYPQAAIRQRGKYYPLEGASERTYRRLAAALEKLAATVPGPTGVARTGNPPTWPQGTVEAVNLSPGEGWQAAPDLYVPVLGRLPRLLPGFAPPEGYTQSIVRLFFADPTVVRRIEERDGATIFTDGRSGLRVYPAGALEFNAPPAAISREEIQADEALSAGLSFLVTHGGYPEGGTIWTCQPLPAGQGSGWALGLALLHEGIPALAPDGAWQLVVGERGLQEFRRVAWLPWQAAGEKRAVMQAGQALAHLRRQLTGQLRINDAFPVYLGSISSPGAAGELRPSWVFRTDRGTWTVDAITGRVGHPEGRW